tara:strand:+ start:322 stop:525 length:204 start_codon:yes stop_codon:yes gene_type:complete
MFIKRDNKLIRAIGDTEKLESALNDLLWHIKVAEESEKNLCIMEVKRLAKLAKGLFDRIDNQIEGGT